MEFGQRDNSVDLKLWQGQSIWSEELPGHSECLAGVWTRSRAKEGGGKKKTKKKKSQLEAIQGQQVPNWDRGRVWFPCAPGQSQHCPKSIIRGVPGGSSLPAREQLLIQTKQGNSIQLFQSPQRTWTSGCQSLQFGRAGRSPQKERTEIPSHFPASMLWEAPSLWIGWVFFT